MPDAGNVTELHDFRPGLNTADPPAELGPGASRDQWNVHLTRVGAAGVRPGRVAYGGPHAGVFLIGHTIKQADGVHFLAASQTNLYAGLPGDLDPVAMYNPGTSTHWPMVPATFQWYADKLCVINTAFFYTVAYTGDPPVWTLTTPSEASLPRGCFSTIHLNLLFVSGNHGEPHKVWYSEPDAPVAEWPANNWFQLSPSRNDPISGLVSHSGTLYVFTASDVWAVTGYDYDLLTDVVVNPLAIPEGCVAPRSIVSHPSGLYYMGRRGIYVVQGRTVQRVSDAVANLLTERDVSWACAFSTPEWIGWSIPSKTDPDSPAFMLVLDLRHKSWAKWDLLPQGFFPWGPKGVCSYQDAEDGHLVYLDPDATNDEGQPITWMWRSSLLLPGGSPVIRGQFQQGRVLAAGKEGPTLVTADWRYDHGPARHGMGIQLRVAGTEWEHRSVSASMPGAGMTLDLTLGAEVLYPFVLEGVILTHKTITAL